MFISECSQFRLYRLDVRSFYESFNQGYIFKKIDDVTGVDVRSKQLLKEFMYEFYVSGGKGVPRGLSISSFLSDYLMHEFDELIRNLPNVFYYARYVDDIILITDGFEDEKILMDYLRQALPDGLEFNNKKYFVSDGLAKVGKENSKNLKKINGF